MEIWVDADACPVVIKNILFRAAQRTGVQLTFVANHPISVPRLRCIKMLQVASGFDVADKEILERLGTGDLVITSDIPLAAQVLEKGGDALNPRGQLYSSDNIREQLNIRDFKDSLRAGGIDTGGPPALNQKNRNAFAGHLNRLLSRSTSLPTG
jgi:hypothetical protein